MKRDFIVLYHQFRMERNRRKAFKMIEITGSYHSFLYQTNDSYRNASNAYRDSKNKLIEMGEYISAVDLLPAKG